MKTGKDPKKTSPIETADKWSRCRKLREIWKCAWIQRSVWTGQEKCVVSWSICAKWKLARILRKRAQSRRPMHQVDAENQGGPGDMLESDVACEPAKKNVWSRDWFWTKGNTSWIETADGWSRCRKPRGIWQCSWTRRSVKNGQENGVTSWPILSKMKTNYNFMKTIQSKTFNRWRRCRKPRGIWKCSWTRRSV